jgi:2-methylisocitrate lyase-like PEP mutase family enzyme
MARRSRNRADALHGFASEFEAVSVVNEAIQNGIGVCWIADQVEPVSNGELAGHHRRAAGVTVLEDFEEAMVSIAVERFEAPVIGDKDVHPGKAFHSRGDAAIALGERQASISRCSPV